MRKLLNKGFKGLKKTSLFVRRLSYSIALKVYSMSREILNLDIEQIE